MSPSCACCWTAWAKSCSSCSEGAGARPPRLTRSCSAAHAAAARSTEGALATYEDLFTFGAPKFIVPAVPDYNEAVDYTQLTFRAHVDAFLEEVRQQCRLPQLRSYLNLYSAISLEKLATLYNHGRDSEDKTPDASLDAVRCVVSGAACPVPGGWLTTHPFARAGSSCCA